MQLRKLTGEAFMHAVGPAAHRTRDTVRKTLGRKWGVHHTARDATPPAAMSNRSSQTTCDVDPVLADVCAVIVTHFPDRRLCERLDKVAAQFPRTIVVDNTPSGDAKLAAIVAKGPPGLHLMLNQANFGIAAALNQGLHLAADLGFRLAVTFDQDTDVEPNLAESLLDQYRLLPDRPALLGANYWDIHKKRVAVECDGGSRGYRERKTLITSGCLVPVSLFRDVGAFREDYFIDSVDHEFCLRARAKGYRVFITCRPLMRQTVGAALRGVGRFPRLLGRRHSVTRRYFMARNTLATAKAYFFDETIWSLCQCLRLAAETTFVLFFERDRASQLTALAVGALHGLRGRLGPIEQAWPRGAA